MYKILSVLFFTCFLSSSYSQIQVELSSLKAKNITNNGFLIAPKTDVSSQLSLRFLPLKNTKDTLYYVSEKPSKQHFIKLDSLKPSQFYKAEFSFYTNKDSTNLEKYYATSSSTSGKILSYFNHEVAVNLATLSEANYVENALRDTLINYINRAEESIDIAIYNSFGNNPTTLIAGALNQAYLDGKRVRVIFDGSTSSTMINVLNSNIGILVRPVNSNQPGIMHHKFMIVDAEHENATKSLVWTGGTNWTTGQINGPDKNNVTIVQDQSLAQTYQMEFEEMWGGSGNFPTSSNVKFGNQKEDNTPKEFVVDGIEVECYFSPSDNAESEILNLINQAQESLVIATMLITRPNLAQAIVDKYNENIPEFAFLIDTENYSGSQKTYLQDNIDEAYYKEYTANGIMHHKMMVVDHGTNNAVLLNGSHNWSFSANNRNDENTLIIFDEDIANQYYQAIAFMFNEVGGNLSTETFQLTEMALYPNPSSSYIEISLTNKTAISEIKMYTSLGKLVLSEANILKEKHRFSIEGLAKGVYLLQLKTTDNQVINQQLIKQ